MRILTVSHTAGSRIHGMVFRPFYLSREFARKGHYAFIVAASFSHNRYRNPDVNADLDEQTIDDVRYLWIKVPRYASEALRAIGMVIFAAKLRCYARRIARAVRPDIVIATSPDPLITFGAWAIARKSGARFVFEFRDIWPLTLVELGKKPRWHPFIVLLKIAERFGLRKAELVVSVLGNARRYLEEIGIAKQRLVTIPNGISIGDVEVAQSAAELPVQHKVQELRSAGKFVLGYVGNHAVANSLQPLIRAMRLLPSSDYALVLVGDGSDKPALLRAVEDLRLDNVYFFAPVPKEGVPGVLALFDACFIASPRSRLYQYGASPNKVFDYMLAGKPIVSALGCDVDPVLEVGCGVKALDNTPESIARAIREVAALSPDERRLVGARGREHVTANHDFAALAQRYLQELTELSQSPSQ